MASSNSTGRSFLAQHAPTLSRLAPLVLAGFALCVTSFAESDVRTHLDKSAHAALECADCHDGAKDGSRPPVCTACHEDAVKDLAASVHGPKSTCSSCHGPIHDLPPSGDTASRTTRHAQSKTCGGCHADPEFVRQHHTSVAHPVEAYGMSIHGRAIERGSEKAAACSSCHGSHRILPSRNAESKVNRWNVPATCGACHTEIKAAYEASVHGAAVKAGMTGAPICTDCHGEHAILAPGEPRSLVNPSRVSAVTCGRCHQDERLAQKYNLPLDKVPAFEDSFHGMAMRSGSQTVANCASCHGVHNILPASDKRSSIHPDNLAKTCGACHPGAGQGFAIGKVHVHSATESEHWIVRSIRLFYWLVIPLTLGGMLLHNALDLLAKMRKPRLRIESDEELPRMNRDFRIAHWLTVISFPLLVITGFALKYPGAFWAAPILALESSIALRGVLHRIAGVVLVLSLLYHVVHLARRKADRVILRELLPSFRDARELLQLQAHNLGRRPEPPHFGKFSYAHKVEY